MPDYSKGKIYKIILDECDEIYVGSTIQLLCNRMSSHRRIGKMRPSPVHKFINEYGWDKANIVLIEDFPCERKEQLYLRERYWIDKIGTLNKQIPTRTYKEWRENNKVKIKEWCEKNKVKILQTSQLYREKNKQLIKEKKREWRENNRDKVLKHMRDYYQRQKDKKINSSPI